MATLVGTQKDLGALLNALIELEYDAVAAYEVAVEKLQLHAYKEQVAQNLSDHKRHIAELKPLAAHLGLQIPNGPDLKQLVTKGKVLAAQLGGDRAILYALRSNEEDTNTAYERAIGHEDASPDLLAVFEGAFADERRHRAWMTHCLNSERDTHETSAELIRDAPGTGNFQAISDLPKA